MDLAPNLFNAGAFLAAAMLLGCGNNTSVGGIPAEPTADLGPVPIELAKLDLQKLEECTAAFEWLAYFTRHETVQDVPADMGLLYRDMWLTALREKANTNLSSAENLKTSAFNSQVVRDGHQSAREAEVMKCVTMTNRALNNIGIESGFE